MRLTPFLAVVRKNNKDFMKIIHVLSLLLFTLPLHAEQKKIDLQNQIKIIIQHTSGTRIIFYLSTSNTIAHIQQQLKNNCTLFHLCNKKHITLYAHKKMPLKKYTQTIGSLLKPGQHTLILTIKE